MWTVRAVHEFSLSKPDTLSTTVLTRTSVVGLHYLSERSDNPYAFFLRVPVITARVQPLDASQLSPHLENNLWKNQQNQAGAAGYSCDGTRP